VNIEPTLTHLLTRHDPFICLVKGEWGVGKTYFIKKFIHENHASIAKQSYSYVSLFGVSSAGDLMHAIYLNTVPTKTLETSFAKIFSRSSSDEAIDRIKLFLGRAKPLLSRLADIPVFGANNIKAFVVNNAAHWFTRNTLIVIDDLERHSSSLSIRDILGILTDLKEERGCQIIIVMNEDALQKDNGDKPYFETKEKVIDREIVFQPTAEDAIAIGLTDREKNQTAAECCRKLQIANIRTIQKIDSTLRQLRDVLAELGVTVPESFDLQLQSTTVLAIWAYWERVIDIDEIENLELGDSTLALMDEADTKLSPEQRNLYERVREYGYSYSDDTDKMIIRFIKTGAIDKKEMRQRVQENDAAVAKRQRDEAMERAWDLYRNTLEQNEDEVCQELYRTHAEAIEDVSISNSSSAVWVLRNLCHEEEAEDLIDKFFARTAPIESYNDYHFREMIIDERFRRRWEEETRRKSADERDIATTIDSFHHHKASTMDDIKRLAQFTEDDFYRWFKTTRYQRALGAAKALAHIEHRLPLVIDETEKVERDVRAALQRISAESRINQLRLRNLFPTPQHDEQQN
jgi:hypothetical protein